MMLEGVFDDFLKIFTKKKAPYEYCGIEVNKINFSIQFIIYFSLAKFSQTVLKKLTRILSD